MYNKQVHKPRKPPHTQTTFPPTNAQWPVTTRPQHTLWASSMTTHRSRSAGTSRWSGRCWAPAASGRRLVARASRSGGPSETSSLIGGTERRCGGPGLDPKRCREMSNCQGLAVLAQSASGHEERVTASPPAWPWFGYDRLKKLWRHTFPAYDVAATTKWDRPAGGRCALTELLLRVAESESESEPTIPASTPTPERLLEFVASLAYVIENLLPFWNKIWSILCIFLSNKNFWTLYNNNFVAGCRQRHLSAGLFTFGKSEDLERFPTSRRRVVSLGMDCIWSFCIKTDQG